MINKILLLFPICYYLSRRNIIRNEDLIVYSIFIIILLKIVLPTEKADMMCPNGPYTKNKKVCKEGNGKLFRFSKINKQDNVKTISLKMNKFIDDKKTQVKWRRFFIMTIILCLLIPYIITNNIPRGKDFLILFFIVFTILIGFDNFYTFHYINIFDNKLKEGLKIIYLLENKSNSTIN